MQVQEQLARYTLPLHLRLPSATTSVLTTPVPLSPRYSGPPLPLTFNGALEDLEACKLANEIVDEIFHKVIAQHENETQAAMPPSLAKLDSINAAVTPVASEFPLATENRLSAISELARVGVRVSINDDNGCSENGVVWKVTKRHVAVGFDDISWKHMDHSIFSNRVRASTVCSLRPRG